MISTTTPATTSSPQDDHDLWETTADFTSSANSSTSSDHISESLSTASTTNDVDNAMRAMQGLRILQPPPIADNGGNYAQQYDASAPIGAATASACGPLDPVLVAGLENARERMTLLKFEDQIVRFLKNSREPHLNFPPLSSYHRLIVHRLAQRCGLEHQTSDYNPYDSSSARVVTLFKTPQSAVPLVLLIDLSTDRQTPVSTPASAPRIMVRKCSVPRTGANGGRNICADKATPSLQDRERAYAEARARIFGDEVNSTTADLMEVPSPTIPVMHKDTINDTGLGYVGPRHGSRQAAGPDNSKESCRNRGSTSSSDITIGLRPLSPKARPSSSVYSPSSLPKAPNAASWKESKVLWRNREQEMNDPDFTRNHNAFRPRSSGGASSGSGSGNESPHYGHRSGSGMIRFGLGDYQSQPYDRSYDRFYDRSFGIRHQQNASAPPPPMLNGSGRGHYYIGGPDLNNRVDLNQYQTSPHHLQQQFQLQQLNPPPTMLMGRGGYGYSSPHGHPSAQQGNWLPPHSNSRLLGSGSNRFIDDDFPPLGK